MSEESKQVVYKDKKQRDPIYITIILMLLIGMGLMYYEMDTSWGEIEECNELNASLSAQHDEMEILLGSDSDDLVANLDKLVTDYDTLIAINAQLGNDKSILIDSLLSEREKVRTLQEEVERGKWQGYELVKKKKELEVLRKVMQGYVSRIDSLITENDILRTRLDNTEIKLTEATETIGKYEVKTNQLEETVAAGQVLKTTALQTQGIRLRSNGSQKETDRASRVNRIQACFTLMENRIAKANTKTLYMRIIGPSGAVVGASSAVFNMGDNEGNYSVSRDVDYANQDLPVCIYHILEEEAAEGMYHVEIWCEGHRIGNTTLDLK